MKAVSDGEFFIMSSNSIFYVGVGVYITNVDFGLVTINVIYFGLVVNHLALVDL